jgi:hypothetical protein
VLPPCLDKPPASGDVSQMTNGELIEAVLAAPPPAATAAARDDGESGR